MVHDVVCTELFKIQVIYGCCFTHYYTCYWVSVEFAHVFYINVNVIIFLLQPQSVSLVFSYENGMLFYQICMLMALASWSNRNTTIVALWEAWIISRSPTIIEPFRTGLYYTDSDLQHSVMHYFTIFYPVFCGNKKVLGMSEKDLLNENIMETNVFTYNTRLYSHTQLKKRIKSSPF